MSRQTIDHTVPGHLGLHRVLDNASSHKTPTSVRDSIKRYGQQINRTGH